MTYTQHIRHSTTPQSRALFGARMSPNHAGGFVFTLDKWKLLDRFLVLGSEGGTYYVSEQALTIENAQNVLACIKENGVEVVRRLVAVSTQGRAPKNDPALFVLALALSYGDIPTQREAYAAIKPVARIGTHLFHLMQYLKDLRGFGRGLTAGLSTWYARKPLALAEQVTKYQQRDGWSHRDVARVIHPANRLGLAADSEHRKILGYAVGRPLDELSFAPDSEAGAYLAAVDALKSETDVQNACKLIAEYSLPREVVPTALLKEADIWEAMLPHMGLTALIRNLRVMTKVRLLGAFGEVTGQVATRIADAAALKQARVHPMQVLLALHTYRNDRTIHPVPRLLEALDAAFTLAFGAVVPTGKRRLLALDISGSMSWNVASGISARVAAAALALVVTRTEPETVVVGFGHTLTPLPVLHTDSVHTLVDRVHKIAFGATDCALPMLWAKEQKLQLDSFEVYTDNETWYGDVHPCEALRQYRKEFNPEAKLVVQGMTATDFSIGDPNDPNTLAVVGFDAATPVLVNDFLRGQA